MLGKQFFKKWHKILSQWQRTAPGLTPQLLRCSAAKQYNELRMLAVTICLCDGVICELCIRRSWPQDT